MKKVSKNRIIFNNWAVSRSDRKETVFYIIQNYAKYASKVDHPRNVQIISWRVEK